MRILFAIVLLNFCFVSANDIDQQKLKIIENFLSTMTTLESEMYMKNTDFDDASECSIEKLWLDSWKQLTTTGKDSIKNRLNKQIYFGKIWLDRKKQLLKIGYGKNWVPNEEFTNFMIARDGFLFISQENGEIQQYKTESTPVGILLNPCIQFDQGDIAAQFLEEQDGIWILRTQYNSPVGFVPVTLYFKSAPVMLLLGWTIQNPNGSITQVFLNPEKTHMAIKINPRVFEVAQPDH